MRQRELAVVHGPPGTGKTTTIVEYILQEVACGHKVLCCAPSNVAVDNLLEKLTAKLKKVVRLGHPARMNQALQRHSLDAIVSCSDQTQLVQDVRADIDKTLGKMKKGKGSAGLRNEVKELRKELRERERNAIKEILQNAQVVLSTLTSANAIDGPLRNLPENHFDVVVIDECSQSLEMACWIAILQSKKVVLAGDHKQLPPTIMSVEAAKKGLELTLMERVIEMFGDEVVRMLTTQYRMNHNIMDWSSKTFYDSKLEAADSVSSRLLCQLPKLDQNEDTGEIPSFYFCSLLTLIFA